MLTLTGVTVTGVAVTGVAGSASVGEGEPSTAAATHPDIALVLIDDFSMELLQTMPRLHDLAYRPGGAARPGVAIYPNSFVVDSLCCPSRAALFDGQYPFLTGVRANKGPQGGYGVWADHDGPGRSFSKALDHDYHTAFMGKFMNGYDIDKAGTLHQPADDTSPRIPGWNTFKAVSAAGYQQWGYRVSRLDRSGKKPAVRWSKRYPEPKQVGKRDAYYATNVLADRAIDVVDAQRREGHPLFLEVAPYGTHSRVGGRAYPKDPLFPPAYADRGDADCGGPCDRLTLADLKGYDDRGTADQRDNVPTIDDADGLRPAASWRAVCGKPCTEWTAGDSLTRLRDRSRMAQSIDRLIARLRARMGPDSYLFVTADNGFHLGQHGLAGGKGTPYDSDIRVPMVVLGPPDRVEAGLRSQIVSNIDLAPTFETLAGRTPSPDRSGVSFATSLTHRDAAPARTVAYVDHTWASDEAADVDKESATEAIPSYVAARTREGLLVRWQRSPRWQPASGVEFAWELYHFTTGPKQAFETTNTYAQQFAKPESQRPAWVRELSSALDAYVACRREQLDGDETGCVRP